MTVGSSFLAKRSPNWSYQNILGAPEDFKMFTHPYHELGDQVHGNDRSQTSRQKLVAEAQYQFLRENSINDSHLGVRAPALGANAAADLRCAETQGYQS